MKKEKGLCRFDVTLSLRNSTSIPRCCPLLSVFKPDCISIPVQVRTGPDGSRRLRLPDFRALDT